jgi:hypothetical protein
MSKFEVQDDIKEALLHVYGAYAERKQFLTNVGLDDDKDERLASLKHVLQILQKLDKDLK